MNLENNGMNESCTLSNYYLLSMFFLKSKGDAKALLGLD
jgi:hypothetical protein